jgi:DNA adenine methylase
MLVKPFLKWAGGKRWLADAVAPLLIPKSGRYVEPFLGGGSVFFNVECNQAWLSDINPELVNTYRVVRDHPEELIWLLKNLSISAGLFQRVRAEKCVSDIARAARILYLNRTAFNGLYRVNRQGEFNVPFGCKVGTRTVDAEVIFECSSKLRQAVLMVSDFRAPLSAITSGDTVFLDPPYTVRHDNNGFRRYNERIFSWGDQIALAQEAKRLARSGTTVVITNAAHAEVLALYPRKTFRAYIASRPTNMAANGSARGLCKEAIVMSESAVEQWARIRPASEDSLRLTLVPSRA